MSNRSSQVLRRLLLAAPLVLIATLLAGSPALAATGLNPIVFPGVSPNGEDLHSLYVLISIPAIVIFVGVEVALLTIIIRDRRKRLGPDYKPPQWHGNTKLEIVWTIIPFVLLVGIGVASFNVLYTDFRVVGDVIAPDRGQTDLAITVTAHQFGYTYTYPEGFKISSEGTGAANTPMVVPTGKLVRLRLQSTDVIHGWWVPEVTGKTDLVPGYDNYTWFKIDQTGEWRGQCTELCGVGHNTMQLRVRAVSPEDYDSWVAEQQAKAAATPTPAASATPSPSPASSASPSPSPSASVRPSPSPS